MGSKVKVCPFCGSEKIDYSIKTTGRWERKYHVAMYCRDCNCYGKRVLITPSETSRYDVEKNPYYRQLAVDAWNTREPMKNITNELTAEIGMLAKVRHDALQKNDISHYDAAGERLAEATLCRAIVEEENNKCMK